MLRHVCHAAWGSGAGLVWCGVVWCGAVRCGAVRCGAVRCGAVRCGAVRCGAVWCGVVWCGVVRCGVVWCGAGVQHRRERWSKWGRCCNRGPVRAACRAALKREPPHIQPAAPHAAPPRRTNPGAAGARPKALYSNLHVAAGVEPLANVRAAAVAGARADVRVAGVGCGGKKWVIRIECGGSTGITRIDCSADVRVAGVGCGGVGQGSRGAWAGRRGGQMAGGNRDLPHQQAQTSAAHHHRILPLLTRVHVTNRRVIQPVDGDPLGRAGGGGVGDAAPAALALGEWQHAEPRLPGGEGTCGGG